LINSTVDRLSGDQLGRRRSARNSVANHVACLGEHVGGVALQGKANHRVPLRSNPTLPALTMASSPIVTPGSTVASAPMNERAPMWTPALYEYRYAAWASHRASAPQKTRDWNA
jgi:hypothetical protein